MFDEENSKTRLLLILLATFSFVNPIYVFFLIITCFVLTTAHEENMHNKNSCNNSGVQREQLNSMKSNGKKMLFCGEKREHYTSNMWKWVDFQIYSFRKYATHIAPPIYISVICVFYDISRCIWAMKIYSRNNKQNTSKKKQRNTTKLINCFRYTP